MDEIELECAMSDMIANQGANVRLEDIPTSKSLMHLAQETTAQGASARNALVLRYAGAIRGYLGALLRNDDDADDVAQRLLLRLLQGAFVGVTLTRGRFRDYLKHSVRNEALNFLRTERKMSGAGVDVAQLSNEESSSLPEEEWLTAYRHSVLEGACRALEAHQERHPGNVFATVLRLLEEHPKEDSKELAERLSTMTGRCYRPANFRQQVRRARRQLAHLLVEQVQQTLTDPTPELVEEELHEVGLMGYVRDFLPALSDKVSGEC
jgi:RNA polymerase sigma factor (sigma-70 family)